MSILQAKWGKALMCFLPLACHGRKLPRLMDLGILLSIWKLLSSWRSESSVLVPKEGVGGGASKIYLFNSSISDVCCGLVTISRGLSVHEEAKGALFVFSQQVTLK